MLPVSVLVPSLGVRCLLLECVGVVFFLSKVVLDPGVGAWFGVITFPPVGEVDTRWWLSVRLLIPPIISLEVSLTRDEAPLLPLGFS